MSEVEWRDRQPDQPATDPDATATQGRFRLKRYGSNIVAELRLPPEGSGISVDRAIWDLSDQLLALSGR